MRFRALATDYDQTLAEQGRVSPEAAAALDRVRAAGRAIILITGRELEDVARVCPRLDRFDAVVAENGGVLHLPGRGLTRALADPPPAALVARLTLAGVTPLGVGRVAIATQEPWRAVVLRTLSDLGLEREVALNKGAVMVLPRGIDKGSGLRAALAELGIDVRDTVGVGDAENDLPFLALCARAAAVAGALPEVRARADVLVDDVPELVDALLARTR